MYSAVRATRLKEFTVTAVLVRAASARELIPDALFRRLTARITADHTEIDQTMAERIMRETLAFLQACAQHPDVHLSPSGPVDIGWHTFLLYTREYAAFCDSVAGRFLHHVPDDDPDTPSQDISSAAVRARTLAAIRTAGYVVDPGLWPVGSTKCSQDGCSASGQDGTENTETRIPPPLGR